MKTGTKEWAGSTANIQLGCEHGCRYCYARYNAVHRFHRCAAEQWYCPALNWGSINKHYGKREGVVMFPSTHDITPKNISVCLCVLRKLLKADNRVLIVSKPHFDCISIICRSFRNYKKQIQFRFTIGSGNEAVLRFWEPNAPFFRERVTCLAYAYNLGFATSVSAEPFLDDNVEELYKTLKPLITDSFWIGKLRDFDKRVDLGSITDEQRIRYVNLLKKHQTDDAIRLLHKRLNGQQFIAWKDSIRKVIES